MKTYFNTVNWIYLRTETENDVSVKEYISEDRKMWKSVWNDGFEEIHKIGA